MDKVMVGACRCPGTPHPEDWVELHPKVPIMVGSAVLRAVQVAGDDEGRLMALMANAYTLFGIRAWSFTDEKGRPLIVDPTSPGWPDMVADLLPWDEGGALVADAADVLYSGKVMRPLLPPALVQKMEEAAGETPPVVTLPLNSSQPGPMVVRTSVTSHTGRTRRTRSKPSSRTSTAGRRSEAPAP